MWKRRKVQQRGSLVSLCGDLGSLTNGWAEHMQCLAEDSLLRKFKKVSKRWQSARDARVPGTVVVDRTLLTAYSVETPERSHLNCKEST